MPFNDGKYIEHNGVQVEKFKENLSVYNPARCGGTFILQVLSCIFYPEVRFLHAEKAHKTDDTLVIPYRDWRDKFGSHWRTDCQIRKELSPERKFEAIMKHVKDDIRVLDEYKKMKDVKILWLRYENFYNNYDWLFKKIESFFNIKIPQPMREYTIKETNVNINKKRADKFKEENPDWDFNTHDNRFGSKMHIDHIDPINKGKPGSWKNIIPREYHKSLEERLHANLKQWGY